MKNIAIILASGKGERTGLNIPKQFVKIADKTVLEHSIDAFEKNSNINEIIVVSNPDYIDLTKNIVLKNNYKKVTKVLPGGVTRRESSYIGVFAVEETDAKVLIHDAVRPFVSQKIINECIDKLNKYNAIDVAVDSSDTPVKVNNDNIIEEIPKRKYIKRSQTPQAFDLKTIRKAHELANKEKFLEVTDDCGLVLNFNLCDVYVVKGEDFNIKITYPIDVAIAEKLFQLRSFES